MNKLLRKRRYESGLVTVEFTIVALLFFTLLFCIIEICRLIFIWHGVTETTRRAARLAAVCQVSPTERADVLSRALLTGVELPGMTTANIQLNYLREDGSSIATSRLTGGSSADFVEAFNDIRYVQAQVVNYSVPLIVPFLTINTNVVGLAFSTTMPRESLGVTRTRLTDC